MKTKADYKLALRVVGAVIDEWDPYALLANGSPKDEFSSEIAAVVTEVPRIHSAQDAARAISRVFSTAFHLQSFAPKDCAEVGEKLFAALCAKRLVDDVAKESSAMDSALRLAEKKGKMTEGA